MQHQFTAFNEKYLAGDLEKKAVSLLLQQTVKELNFHKVDQVSHYTPAGCVEAHEVVRQTRLIH